LLSVQVHATVAELLNGVLALFATFTFSVMPEVPFAAIGVALSVQVTSCPLALHVQPVPVPLANVSPAGNVSVTVMVPLLAPKPPLVTVRVYCAPCWPCVKPLPTCAFEIVRSGAPPPTVSVAVLLAAPADGVCVVVTPDVVLGFPPTVLLVTLKITVQLLLAGIVIPVKLSAVWPAVSVDGVVPLQVPVTDPPTALMLLKVSVNAPPVKLEPLLLDNVRVTTELPPD
jgi:hypothetical protein